MDLRRTLLLFSFIFAGSLAIAQPKDRWTIQDDGAIRWNINDNIPHDDHLEMSGQQLSVVLRYGVDAQKRFHLTRSLVFPMLRMHPNKTQNNLKQRFDVNIPALVTVDDQTLLNEEVRDVTFNGIKKLNPGKVTVLHADDIQAENKIDNKNVVVPVVSDAQVQGNVLNVKMKPNSFVVYRF